MKYKAVHDIFCQSPDEQSQQQITGKQSNSVDHYGFPAEITYYRNINNQRNKIRYFGQPLQKWVPEHSDRFAGIRYKILLHHLKI
jgi:hypothetical protein